MLAFAAGGCAIEAPGGWEGALANTIRDDPDRFAAGKHILAGIAPPVPDGELAAGDEVLFGICLDVGARRTIWYLDVQVVAITNQRWLDLRSVPDFEDRVHADPERQRELDAAQARFRQTLGQRDLMDLAREEPVARIRVEAFDADGRSLDVGESEAIAWRLQRGLLPACTAGYRLRDVMRGRVALGRAAAPIELAGADYDAIKVVANGVASCELFFQILKQNPVTRRILYQVIALPTLWSMIRRLGVRATMDVDFFAACGVEGGRYPGTTRGLWSVPVAIRLNDQPAMLACLIAGPAGSPDGAVAGIFGIVGQHPGDPERRIAVQLLASRNGTR
ncbi:MAG: hypothetical protein U1E73_06440 [Planctomycetota bacterium]